MKILALACLAAIGSQAQTFTSLASFNVPYGITPYASLVQGLDGKLYGTAFAGNADSLDNGFGTVFSITRSGSLTPIYYFCSQPVCADGDSPKAAVLQATDGNLYGTTEDGGSGSNPSGTVFRLTPEGTLTTLFTFDGPNGGGPVGPLIQASDGTFYGTTEVGGTHPFDGTILKITRTGTLTTLFNFALTDGADPNSLVEGSDGDLYGSTPDGGANRLGTIFKLTPSGTFTVLFTFAMTDGAFPTPLVRGRDGNLYGCTASGGGGDGTVFSITPAGDLTTIHRFDGTDGQYATGGLVQGTDGKFYGTTSVGGANNLGTIFQITPAGAFQTLHSFSGPDGYQPSAALVQDTDGNFYGTTPSGGTAGLGTVFELSMGLSPFVETLVRAAQAGALVQILGRI
jgi:uncharacterized repeat protein (TIGR03803 family)